MIGRNIGHYRVVRSLGSGGMGEVWAAEDTKLGRQVALKLLPADMAADPERVARFEREAKAIASLDHPNIVTIHSIEQAQGDHFITMQLVEGHTLAELLAGTAGAGVPLRQFFDIAAPLADAVSAAHGQGIAHRDLKPANVMVTADGRVLVLDFGLAKILALDGGDDETVGPQEALTSEGTIVGTVAYMSPEQAEGKLVDQRSDLFSLGVLLYELSTGKRPFVGDTQMSVLTSIIRDTPPSITDLNPALPRHLGRIIKHCLEKDPERRLQSAKDLRNTLEELRQELESDPALDVPDPLASASISSPAALETARRGARARGPWIVAAAILVVMVGVWWMQHRAAQDRLAETLAEITALATIGDLDEAHARLLTAGLDLGDAALAPLAAHAGTLSLTTEPSFTEATLTRVGPIDAFDEREGSDLAAPVRAVPLLAGEYHLHVRAEGQQPLHLPVLIEPGQETAIERHLVAPDPEHGGMVRVDSGPSPLDGAVIVPAFLIDAHEVTNAAYLEFVSAGGYRDLELWPASFLMDGSSIPTAEALRGLVDRTGIPGPRDWSGGRHPDDAGEHPVSGISWYEATAYAGWRGKRLPNAHEWWRAAIGASGRAMPWGNDVRTIDARANFGLSGGAAVGSFILGASPFGCFDMAGNVREWLADDRDGLPLVAGGSWRDPAYMFDPSAMEAFARDYARDSIGLRLVIAPAPEG